MLEDCGLRREGMGSPCRQAGRAVPGLALREVTLCPVLLATLHHSLPRASPSSPSLGPPGTSFWEEVLN